MYEIDGYYTIAQFAEEVNESYGIVQYWVQRNYIHYHHKGKQGVYYFTQEEVDKVKKCRPSALSLGIDKRTNRHFTYDPEKTYILYCHLNKINGKMYIGVTSESSVEDRWGRYPERAYESCRHFYNAIKKYGWDSFEHFTLLEGVDYRIIEDLERYMIKKYNTSDREYGYNILEGGNLFTGSMKGTNAKNTVPVFQYSLEGKFIKKHHSLKMASIDVFGNEDHDMRIMQCKNGTRCAGVPTRIHGGFIWLGEYIGDYVEPYKIHGMRRVGMFDKKTGELIKEYYCYNDAKHDFNDVGAHIKEVCDHKTNRKSAYGYKWEYLDPESEVIV